MIRIKMFSASEEERAAAEKWQQDHPHIDLVITSDHLTMETVDQVVGFDGICVKIGVQVDDQLYPALFERGIRQMAQRSAGVDYYNLEEARSQGIIVSGVGAYSPESIAEFTVTAALYLIRHIETIQHHVTQRDFRWLPSIRGAVVKEMTIGIVGTGNIGCQVARIFNGFGANVIGYNRSPRKEAEAVLTYVQSIEELVSQADIVSLHMPATKENYRQFNDALFAKFKPGSYLLNMARGEIVDTASLIRALDKGILAGAALDTFDGERDYLNRQVTDNNDIHDDFKSILEHPQIFYSPHVAYYTDTAIHNIVANALDATLEVIETGDTRFRMN